VAHCLRAGARNVRYGVPARKFAGTYFLRPGGGGGVFRVAACDWFEPAILAACGMRAGGVGSGERRLDVLRNRAAHGASHGLGGALPVWHAIDLLCARSVSESG